ncbi:MAG: hypothetical protein AABZ60_03775 [Planctomycetota bacterium]
MFNTHKKTPSFVHIVELLSFSGGDFHHLFTQSQHYRRAYNAILGHLKKQLRRNRDFKLYTNSAVLQKVAVRAFSAIEKLMYGKAKRVRFKSASEKMSFEGRQNNTGIRFLCVDSIEKALYGRKYKG